MSILPAFLRKKGIDSPDQLSPEERKTYENWRKILTSDDDVSVERIKEFCLYQIGVIESKWKNIEYQGKEKLIPYHTCYKLILDAINAPAIQREALEKHLNQLINE